MSNWSATDWWFIVIHLDFNWIVYVTLIAAHGDVESLMIQFFTFNFFCDSLAFVPSFIVIKKKCHQHLFIVFLISLRFLVYQSKSDHYVEWLTEVAKNCRDDTISESDVIGR